MLIHKIRLNVASQYAYLTALTIWCPPYSTNYMVLLYFVSHLNLRSISIQVQGVSYQMDF